MYYVWLLNWELIHNLSGRVETNTDCSKIGFKSRIKYKLSSYADVVIKS